jgi:hypothetical protein
VDATPIWWIIICTFELFSKIEKNIPISAWEETGNECIWHEK